MRNKRGPFTIVITKIINGSCEKLPLMIFKDTDVFSEIADDVGNFFSWSAIYIKRYIKDRGVSDTVFCEWYLDYDGMSSSSERNLAIAVPFESNIENKNEKKRYAYIVLGCGSDGQFSDGPLYQ